MSKRWFENTIKDLPGGVEFGRACPIMSHKVWKTPSEARDYPLDPDPDNHMVYVLNVYALRQFDLRSEHWQSWDALFESEKNPEEERLINPKVLANLTAQGSTQEITRLKASAYRMFLDRVVRPVRIQSTVASYPSIDPTSHAVQVHARVATAIRDNRSVQGSFDENLTGQSEANPSFNADYGAIVTKPAEWGVPISKPPEPQIPADQTKLGTLDRAKNAGDVK